MLDPIRRAGARGRPGHSARSRPSWLAHVELVSSDPADGSTVTSPFTVDLRTFSQRLASWTARHALLKPVGGDVAQGGVDPTDDKPMVATADLARDRVHTRSNGRRTRRRQRGLHEATWTFTVAAAPSPSPPRPRRHPTASAVPSAARQRPPRQARSPRRAAPDGAHRPTGDATRERQRRHPADHRRPDRPRRRGRLPPEPPQPPTRPVVIRDAARGRAGGPRQRRPSALALGLAVCPARDRRRAHAQRDLHQPPAAGRLPRRCRHHRRAVVRFVIVRDVRAAPPDLDADGVPATGVAALHAPRARPDRLDLDHRPGDRRRTRATRTSRRSSCGSTAGSGWRSSAR